jgi:signal transduction histidine kinase
MLERLITFWMMAAISLVLTLPGGAEEVLRSLGAVRELTPQEAARGRMAELEVTATYVVLHRHSLFVHDGVDGIFLMMPSDKAKPGDVVPGDRIWIRAKTREGGFLPDLQCERWEKRAGNALPPPMEAGPENLFDPLLDCAWCRVSGVVTGTEPVVDGQFVVGMDLYGWGIKILMPLAPGIEEEVARLMQRRVTFTGIAATVFNGQRQMTGRYFFVQGPGSFITQDDAPSAIPLQVDRVDRLLRSGTTTLDWIRLRGVVTYATPNDIFLRGQGGSLKVRHAGARKYEAGDEVEVDGYATLAAFRPGMRARQIRVLRQGPPPVPLRLAEYEKDLPVLAAELIVAEAEYLGGWPQGEAFVMQCRSGERFFEALLPVAWPIPPGLERGSLLRLTGCCELTTTQPLPRSQWVDGFRLNLRNGADLTILRQPSWWRPERLLVALALLAAVVLGTFVWVATLRRHVNHQTAVIGAQIEREAVISERRRIARDFHDTLEQELTGVAIQLENAAENFTHDHDRARQSLQLAEKMLRFSREEARTSILNLRSLSFGPGRLLEAALRESLPAVAAQGTAELDLEVSGQPVPLDAMVENHLLRMARELVANAVRHAGAGRITVRLNYQENGGVALVISDDGAGFDFDAPPPPGHFGLIGLRERAFKIGAQLHLRSLPGEGTEVRILRPAVASMATAEEAI